MIHSSALSSAVVCAIAVTACGSSPSSSPSPTPTIKQAAAKAYEVASKAADKGTMVAVKLCSGTSPSAADLQACYGSLVADDKAFISALGAIHFPPPMQVDVDALTKALSDCSAAETALAAAANPDTDYMDAVTLKTAEAARITAAATVRMDLVLPAVPLTPKPPPTVRQVAAAAYLAAATTVNAADDAAGKLCPGNSPSNAQLKACFGAYYTATQAFIQAIFAITFPSDMKADVNALITADTQEASDYSSISSSPDPQYDNSGFNALQTAEGAQVAAAGVVRHDLGLPPVPLSTPAP